MGSAGPVKRRVNRAFAMLGLSSGWWTRGRAEPEARAKRGRAVVLARTVGIGLGQGLRGQAGHHDRRPVDAWPGQGGGSGAGGAAARRCSRVSTKWASVGARRPVSARVRAMASACAQWPAASRRGRASAPAGRRGSSARRSGRAASRRCLGRRRRACRRCPASVKAWRAPAGRPGHRTSPSRSQLTRGRAASRRCRGRRRRACRAMFLLSVKAWRAPGRSPWARRTSPSLFQLIGEVALPLGVAGSAAASLSRMFLLSV